MSIKSKIWIILSQNKQKQTKSKTKKTEEKSKEVTTEKEQDADNYDNYYVFESLSSEKIQTKYSQPQNKIFEVGCVLVQVNQNQVPGDALEMCNVSGNEIRRE